MNAAVGIGDPSRQAAAPIGWAAITTTHWQTLTFDTLTDTDLSSDNSIIHVRLWRVRQRYRPFQRVQLGGWGSARCGGEQVKTPRSM